MVVNLWKFWPFRRLRRCLNNNNIVKTLSNPFMYHRLFIVLTSTSSYLSLVSPIHHLVQLIHHPPWQSHYPYKQSLHISYHRVDNFVSTTMSSCRSCMCKLVWTWRLFYPYLHDYIRIKYALQNLKTIIINLITYT